MSTYIEDLDRLPTASIDVADQALARCLKTCDDTCYVTCLLTSW
jgi:hypothetical protein